MIGLSLYTLRDRQRSLSGIILFFLVLLWLSLYGPQSATSLSTRMQYNYFLDLMTKNDFLTEDMSIQPQELSLQAGVWLTGDLAHIHTVVAYLVDAEGVDLFRPLYRWTGFDNLSWAGRWDFADRFMISLGVDESVLSLPVGYNDTYYVSFYTDETSNALPIAGYTSMFAINSYTLSMKASVESTDESLLTLTTATKTYTIDINAHVMTLDAAIRSTAGRTEPLIFIADDYMLVLKQLSGIKNTQTGRISVNEYNGFVFVK